MNLTMPSTRTATCQPWCIDHDDENGLCFSERLRVGEHDRYNSPIDIGISYEHGASGELVINVGDRIMSLDETRKFALALMRQFDRARTAQPMQLEVTR